MRILLGVCFGPGGVVSEEAEGLRAAAEPSAKYINFVYFVKLNSRG
jgi:hypothetical protein